MTLDNGGNLGLGTTSPDIFSSGFARNFGVAVTGASTTASINVSGGVASRIQFGVGSTRYGLLYQDDTNFMQIGTTTALPISIITNSTERVRINSSGNTLQMTGRSSTAYGTLANVQEWTGQVTSIAAGASFSLFDIVTIYDVLCYDLNIFANAGSFLAYKSAGIFGYSGFNQTILGSNLGLTITKTGTLYNETMTLTNANGNTVNVYDISLRVWGYGVQNSVSTGGADLISSSYLVRQN
jgi:hypothetical protein